MCEIKIEIRLERERGNQKGVLTKSHVAKTTEAGKKVSFKKKSRIAVLQPHDFPTLPQALGSTQQQHQNRDEHESIRWNVF